MCPYLHGTLLYAVGRRHMEQGAAAAQHTGHQGISRIPACVAAALSGPKCRSARGHLFRPQWLAFPRGSAEVHCVILGNHLPNVELNCKD